VTRTQRVTTVAGFVAGAVLAMSAGATWVSVRYPGRTRTATGGRLAGSLVPVGLIAVAGMVAVLATRRRARIPVGLAIAASGATAFAQCLDVVANPTERAFAATRSSALDAVATHPVGVSWWAVVALLSAAVVAVVGVVVTLRGPTWAGMSAKYDAPAGPPSETDLWSALDRGEDPTNTMPP
jgi:uncharacterized membrane protein (TIGR02234 family)